MPASGRLICAFEATPGLRNHVILSGCSGGGKSTLLAALADRGFATVPEPGRRIVAAAQAGKGGTLPWDDLAGFARQALAMARQDRAQAPQVGDWVFFDRGLIDAAVALAHATGQPPAGLLAGTPRYHQQVFLTPPWPEIFRQDAERRHGLDAAIAEYDRLTAAYAALGYQVIVLPKAPVPQRVAFVLAQLRGSQP